MGMVKILRLMFTDGEGEEAFRDRLWECEECGVLFEAARSDCQFCSTACRMRAYRRRKRLRWDGWPGKRNDHRELLIFITPHIVRDYSEGDLAYENAMKRFKKNTMKGLLTGDDDDDQQSDESQPQEGN